MKLFALTSAFLIAATSSAAFASIQPQNCHPKQGVWVQTTIIDMYKADPCSVTVKTSTGKHVLKLDRIRVSCEGEAISSFGFDDERYDGDTFDVNLLKFVSPVVLVVEGYPAEYVQVSASQLDKIFQTARTCLAEAAQ